MRLRAFRFFDRISRSQKDGAGGSGLKGFLWPGLEMSEGFRGSSGVIVMAVGGMQKTIVPPIRGSARDSCIKPDSSDAAQANYNA